jgi:hypothetical protein
VKLPAARISRDTILFIGGLSGLAYETFTSGAEKPTLIIGFLGMLGLPLFIRGDEHRRNGKSEDAPKEDAPQ